MYSFELEEGEKLISVYRQTEAILIRPTVAVLLALYLPLWYLLKYDLLSMFVWLLMAWIVLIAAYGLNAYLKWLVSVLIITDKRAVLVRYNSPFKREIHETLLPHVRNVVTKTTGMFSSLLGFGDIAFETTNQDALLVFTKVRNPELVKKTVWLALKMASNKPKIIPGFQTKTL